MSKKVIITEDGKKQCTKCGDWKLLDEFDISSKASCGRYGMCKECRAKYRLENKERIAQQRKEYEARHPGRHNEQSNRSYYKRHEYCLKRHKEYRDSHKDEMAAYKKEWYAANKDYVKRKSKEYQEAHKEQIAEKHKEYYENNKAAIFEKRNDKRANDAMFRLQENARGMIRGSFNRMGTRKSGRTFEIIGMCGKDFTEYLIQTYKDMYGQEWDGVESVHIDHIIPLATAKTEEDIFRLCHYTNLQLLKATDNLRKNDRLDWKLNESEGIKDGDNQMFADAE